MSFENKVILITGASSGIGAASAVYFAKEKASLSLVGRNAEKFEKLKNDLNNSECANEPLIILADVSTDAEQIVAKTIEKFGRIDVLINCAGFGKPQSLETIDVNVHDEIFATNVRGAVEVAKLALPHLIKTKGNIVNVSSGLGLRPVANFLSYSMSKASLDHFTKCAALELAGKGVRVNSVNPGIIATDFHFTSGLANDETYEQFLAYGSSIHPIGRVGTSDEVVQGIAFLANEKTASFITGVLLPIDGGYVLGGK